MTEPSEPDAGDDVTALQSELAELRARNRMLEHARQVSVLARIGGISKAAASAILIVVGVLCLVLAPAAIWGRNLVLDTDRYVDTITPVASDPGVQQVVINAVDKQVSSNLDLTGTIDQFLPDRLAQLIGPPLQSAVEGLIHNVTTSFVQSDAFQTLWANINRAAHQQLTYLLTGDRPANATVKLNDEGKLILDLGQVVERVKQRLVDAGLAPARLVPTVGATVEIADVPGVVKAQKGVRLLDRAADWLPWIGLVLVAIGLIVARRRRRALISAALGLAVGMVVIGIGVIFARGYYLDHVPPQVPGPTASYLFDTLLRDLRWALRILLLLALLIAFGAWVSGPSRAAGSVRHYAVVGPRALGHRLPTGPVGAFVDRYATAFRIGVIALMLVILLLIDAPTLGTVILLAVLAVVLLLVIELLRASAARSRRRAVADTVTPSG